jgi:hypothetical protein
MATRKTKHSSHLHTHTHIINKHKSHRITHIEWRCDTSFTARLTLGEVPEVNPR